MQRSCRIKVSWRFWKVKLKDWKKSSVPPANMLDTRVSLMMSLTIIVQRGSALIFKNQSGCQRQPQSMTSQSHIIWNLFLHAFHVSVNSFLSLSPDSTVIPDVWKCVWSQSVVTSLFASCYCYGNNSIYSLSRFYKTLHMTSTPRPASCTSCRVCALSGSQNKEVVDQATYLPIYTLMEGEESLLWYESDTTMIGIQWPGNAISPSLFLRPCLSFSEQGYQQRLSGYDNGWLLHADSEEFTYNA